MKNTRLVPMWIYPVLFVMAIGTVWLRLYIVRSTYEINQADRMIHNLQQESEQMQLKLTGLRSPRRLETIAKVKYQLFPPRADQIVHMRGSQAQ